VTAPYQRPDADRTVGHHRDRVKKLEGADMLGRGLAWGIYDQFTGDVVYEDDGSTPSGYFFSDAGILTQEYVVNCWVDFQAVGGWAPGTGTVFLVPLTVEADPSLTGLPLGFGISTDISLGAQTVIYFRVSNLSPDGIHGYIEAVVAADGSLVGPGNPYTWAAGDSPWMGAFSYWTNPPEYYTP
jgi:hypothetical protein